MQSSALGCRRLSKVRCMAGHTSPGWDTLCVASPAHLVPPPPQGQSPEGTACRGPTEDATTSPASAWVGAMGPSLQVMEQLALVWWGSRAGAQSLHPQQGWGRGPKRPGGVCSTPSLGRQLAGHRDLHLLLGHLLVLLGGRDGHCNQPNTPHTA